MEKIIEKFVGFISEKLPRYFLDLLRLASGPKSYLCEEISDPIDTRKGFTFLFLSILFANFLFLPSIPSDQLTISNGFAVFSYSVLFIALHLLMLLLSWRLVRSSPPITPVVVIYSYVASISAFIQVIWVWSLMFISRAYSMDEGLWKELQSASDERSMEIYANNPEMMAAVLWIIVSFGVYFLADFVWWLVSWGAFRRAVGVGWWRSSAAFLISVIMSWALFAFSIAFLLTILPEMTNGLN